MKNLKLALLAAAFLSAPLLGQSPEKIATINKKVVGKWWSTDKKNYIEFKADGDCSEGALFPDGKWHVETGKLSMWQKGENFICSNGALTWVGPNKLTRDYGMGGEPEIYRREFTRHPATAGK